MKKLWFLLRMWLGPRLPHSPLLGTSRIPESVVGVLWVSYPVSPVRLGLSLEESTAEGAGGGTAVFSLLREAWHNLWDHQSPDCKLKGVSVLDC